MYALKADAKDREAALSLLIIDHVIISYLWDGRSINQLVVEGPTQLS